jgi:hypothetical protein
MHKRIVLALLLLVVFAGKKAKADELQFSGGTVNFWNTTYNGTNGVNFSISNETIDGSDPAGDTAIGSTITFGSQPVAFFASSSGGLGTVLSPPQTLTITGPGGNFYANITGITLDNPASGIFDLNVTVTAASLSPSNASSQALQDLFASGGSAVMTFQFRSTSFQTMSQVLNYSSATWKTSGASGAIDNNAPVSAPEPAAAMLLVTGLLGTGLLRRKK